MNFAKIYENKEILYNIDLQTILSLINKDKTTLIYLTNKMNNTIAKNFDNISLIQINKRISRKEILKIKKETFVFIDLDTIVDYKVMVSLIKKLIKIFKILFKQNKIPYLDINSHNVILAISSNNTMEYFQDICTSLKAIFTSSKKEKYEVIYDYVCEYLDNEFKNKKLCDFNNNICAASREGLTKNKFNGCCYSFEYGTGGIIINYKPCKYLINGNCTAKCISCKLHTCFYLKTKNIYFKTNKILLLKSFFSQKQHLILKNNFFKSKDEIINKLCKTNFMPYIIYYIFELYKIR